MPYSVAARAKRMAHYFFLQLEEFKVLSGFQWRQNLSIQNKNCEVSFSFKTKETLKLIKTKSKGMFKQYPTIETVSYISMLRSGLSVNYN